MDVSIPIYVETLRSKEGAIYSCRPLFFDIQPKKDALLSRAMNKLTGKVKQFLDELGRKQRHEDLARACLCPDLTTHNYKFKLELKSQRVSTKFLFVEFEEWNERIVFCPTIRDSWLKVPEDEELHAFLETWLQGHIRQQGRLGHDVTEYLRRSTIQSKAWVAQMDLRIKVKPETDEEERSKFATLWDETKVDGATELGKVGRCLDDFYPDDLDRALLRDREVAELERLLSLVDRRPVVLLGPNKVGKTTILHECVFRRVAARAGHSAKHNFWMLSPQRLISGMSYVGQWENRLLAIIKEAKRRDHVLFFQDFMGLYHAGSSSDSDLSVAQVLKNHVTRRDVRVLTEMTPEQWNRFRERDRGLADQFHVLPVHEPTDRETTRILLSVQRALEGRTRRHFTPDVLPAVIELQRRYVRDAAFPGKAADFLRRLVAKSEVEEISRAVVLGEFHSQTGVSLQLLDERERLPRGDIESALRKDLVGQDAALRAAVDVVSIAKARVNSPDRPIAAMLFLGPTGVGKTQCAKSLAQYLFGDEERLIRFDMNEFISPHSIVSLVGLPHQPEGLLTTAVRRQPFSVVLLDEVEKAHPDLFDLLLQVTGEGRLTDAVGRVADFTNCIIIMTSNLGSQDAGRSAGFSASESSQSVYRKAAEQFFRPEFFNRLDHVIPFTPLSRDHIRQIARLLIGNVFQREGLARRQSMLVVEERAMENVVDAGYHPKLGARALKRAIERQLTAPLAARLAAMSLDTPAVISLFASGGQIAIRVDALTPAPLRDSWKHPEQEGEQIKILEAAEAAAARIEVEVSEDRPTGTISLADLTPAQCLYFQIKEQATLIRELSDKMRNAIRRKKAKRAPSTAAESVRNRVPVQCRHRGSARRTLLEMTAAQEVQDYLRQASFVDAQRDDETRATATLRNEAALLQTLVGSRKRPERVLLICRVAQPEHYTLAEQMRDRYRQVAVDIGIDTVEVKSEPDTVDKTSCFLGLSGPIAWWLGRHESGTQLFYRERGAIVPLQTISVTVSDDETWEATGNRWFADREKWLSQLANGEGDVDSDPCPWGQLLRVFDVQDRGMDMRSELSFQFASDTKLSFRDVILSGLPAPIEVETACTE